MAKRNFPEKKKVKNDSPIDAITDTVGISESLESSVDGSDETSNAKIYGKVCNCKKLNVRENPSINSATKCLPLSEGSTVQIDETKSTAEWYCVTTEDGIEGFCMRKYICLQS